MTYVALPRRLKSRIASFYSGKLSSESFGIILDSAIILNIPPSQWTEPNRVK